MVTNIIQWSLCVHACVLVYIHVCVYAGLFCDGTHRYGVPAPFSKARRKIIFYVYISYFWLASTSSYLKMFKNNTHV